VCFTLPSESSNNEYSPVKMLIVFYKNKLKYNKYLRTEGVDRMHASLRHMYMPRMIDREGKRRFFADYEWNRVWTAKLGHKYAGSSLGCYCKINSGQLIGAHGMEDNLTQYANYICCTQQETAFHTSWRSAPTQE
jgi:hypothetical protein